MNRYKLYVTSHTEKDLWHQPDDWQGIVKAKNPNEVIKNWVASLRRKGPNHGSALKRAKVVLVTEEETIYNRVFNEDMGGFYPSNSSTESTLE